MSKIEQVDSALHSDLSIDLTKYQEVENRQRQRKARMLIPLPADLSFDEHPDF